MHVDIWSDVVCPWCQEVRHADMALGVSGAQPTDMFSTALDQAWARRG